MRECVFVHYLFDGHAAGELTNDDLNRHASALDHGLAERDLGVNNDSWSHLCPHLPLHSSFKHRRRAVTHRRAHYSQRPDRRAPVGPREQY